MFELVYPVSPAPVLPLPTSDTPGVMPEAGAEMVPVVDESGQVIGQAARKYVHGGSKLLHPVIHLHILNRKGEIFLQKRSMKKALLPGKWDTAVGGHVDYGESFDAALHREAGEELGFVDFNPVLLKSYIWESRREKELVNVYVAIGNFVLDPSNEEVSEGRYWSFDEIDAKSGKNVLTPNFEKEFNDIRASLTSLL